MSERKHTPGPWLTHVKETHPGEIQIGAGPLDDEGWPEWNIAECFGGLDEGEQEANACLIAAAPETLEAGKRVLNYATLDEILSDPSKHDDSVFGIRLGDLRNLRAAIARATQSEAAK